MKVLQFTCAALVIYSYLGTGFAADIIVLPSESGKVIFTHKKHQEAIKNCKVCHKTALGTIKEFGQCRPHKLCIGCHEKKKSGPIDCVGCHKTSGSYFPGSPRCMKSIALSIPRCLRQGSSLETVSKVHGYTFLQ